MFISNINLLKVLKRSHGNGPLFLPSHDTLGDQVHTKNLENIIPNSIEHCWKPCPHSLHYQNRFSSYYLASTLSFWKSPCPVPWNPTVTRQSLCRVNPGPVHLCLMAPNSGHLRRKANSLYPLRIKQLNVKSTSFLALFKFGIRKMTLVFN